MRFFTADLHLGDKTIARWRGFEGTAGIAEHDARIIAGINQRVAVNDELWILGDICKARLEDVEALRDAILCRNIHIIVGNHDSRSKFVTCGRFASVDYYGQIGRVRKDGYKFVMCHYPMLDWDRAYHGAYMLHGHIHSLPLELAGPIQPRESREGGMGMRGYNAACAEKGIRRLDVGVDACGYQPISAEEIVAALPSDEEWSAIHGLPVD